ncbi:thioredoxin-dependent thiol peroxidase [Paraflavisolibacter sp. H34]|uniref:thioredoxin-dependent thiol peroxidase n=1 Tax=Huijunlia imazamoxiresistens TaxID=3127457 RepID=UPI003018C2C3
MATELKAGDQAPEFSGKDQNGNEVSLKDFKGKKVVLYFYPKDDTPGCTAQACNLRDNFSTLKAQGFEILGVSPDDAGSHQAFREKYQLPFPLLADPERQIIEQYGVWGEKNSYGKVTIGLLRTTFVIDEEGTIQKVFKRPNTKEHAEEILK